MEGVGPTSNLVEIRNLVERLSAQDAGSIDVRPQHYASDTSESQRDLGRVAQGSGQFQALLVQLACVLVVALLEREHPRLKQRFSAQSICCGTKRQGAVEMSPSLFDTARGLPEHDHRQSQLQPLVESLLLEEPRERFVQISTAFLKPGGGLSCPVTRERSFGICSHTQQSQGVRVVDHGGATH